MWQKLKALPFIQNIRGLPWQRWRSSTALWNVLSLLAPLVVLYCVQLITLQSGAAVLDWFAQTPWVALTTYLVLLAGQLLLTALTGSLFWPVLAVGAPVTVLALASYLKESINGTPLLVSDLAMAGRAGDIASFLAPGVELGTVAWEAVAALAVLLLAVGFFAGRKHRRGKWTRSWRAYASMCCVLVLAVVLWPGNASALLKGDSEETQAERNDRLGLLAGLYDGLLTSAATPPDAYTEGNMNQLLVAARHSARSQERDPEAVRPNVVLVMSESFCDPSVMLPGVSFSSDPIPNYHALAEDFPAGSFLSNTYAGGTGNVEMEVLTGVPLGFVSQGEDLTSLKDSSAYERMPSIVRAFRDQGYATEFVHSYTDRLYNRRDNLPKVGYETVLFQEDFPEDAQWDGPYLTDLALADKMITEFEARDRDKPMFLFGLTMENHQPYFAEKFDGPSGLDPACAALDPWQLGTVDALAQGLNGADAGLKALVDYFTDCGEPVLLVFWGDHLPSLYLDPEDTVYSKLDYVDTANTKAWDSETMKKMHTTPYLVWNNFGADLEVPETLSAATLGAHILDWAGAERPLFFEWNALASQDMLLYRQRLFVDGAGEPYRTIPPASRQTMAAYENLVYDLLYGEGYVAREMLTLPSVLALGGSGS